MKKNFFTAKMNNLLLGALCILSITPLYSQTDVSSFFEEVAFSIGSQTYRYSSDTMRVNGEPKLVFIYGEESPQVEVKLIPLPHLFFDTLEIQPSGDFKLVDSLVNFNDSFYRCKIQFQNITNANFLSIIIKIREAGTEKYSIVQLKLQPVLHTIAKLQLTDTVLFIGEEKSLDVEVNHIENLRFSKTWVEGEEINYKFSRNKNRLRIHLLPKQLGIIQLNARLGLKKPRMDAYGQLYFRLPPLRYEFLVKPAKLAYLNMNRRELVFDQSQPGLGVEVELEYHPQLELEKTYRLEAQEEPGGKLVAELFTRNILANGRVLCWLRLYDFHRRADGYLYVKDGDESTFITNFNILHKLSISNVQVHREGKDWTNSRDLYPGEKVSIRLQGQGLNKGDFSFEGCTQVSLDTLSRNEREVTYRLLVPVNIDLRRIKIFNNGQPTGQSLRVREYSRAKKFEFVSVEYGVQRVNFAETNELQLVEEAFNNILIEFDEEKIDEPTRFYGPQYLDVTVDLRTQKGALIDTRTIRKIKVCPGSSSPRQSFYDRKDCWKGVLSLNKYLRRKIYNLEPWSSIEITIKHNEQVHGKSGFNKFIRLILQQKTALNLEVSFPAGLIIKRIGEAGFGNLGGISMAMIAQFNFYKPNRIAQFRPFKIGFGFLALNAFNFSENNNNRDVGIVGLGSVYPLQKGQSRLSFPLYAGGGYFLGESQWFWLLGPGIRLRL